MENNTYKAVCPATGREWTLKPVPKHAVMEYGFVPDSLTEQARKALTAGDDETFGEEILKTATEKDLQKMAKFQEFTKFALKYAVVSPSIVLEPEADNEISVFEVTDEEKTWLIKTILDVRGGEANRLKSFRKKPGLASRGGIASEKLQSKAVGNTGSKESA